MTVRYFFLLLLACTATGLSAQITLTAENFGTLDTVLLEQTIYADSDVYSPPRGGANQVWDFSDASPDLFSTSFNFLPPNDTCFGGATSAFNNPRMLQAFVIPATAYETTNQEGRFIVGDKVLETKFPLVTITGGVNDTLAFSAVSIERMDPVVRFPLTADVENIDTTIEALPFELTVAGFGLTNTPGAQLAESRFYKEVIGYGTLILPQSDGSVTEPLETLLVRDSVATTVTYTLGGAPAPGALLAAFGLQETNESYQIAYFFYVKGLGRAACYFARTDRSPGAQQFQLNFRDVPPGTTTGTNNIELLNLSLSPNPVRPGENLRLTGVADLASGSVRLLDQQGRIISERTFRNANGTILDLPVPVATPSGLYFYQLINDSGQPVGVGKIMVR